MLAAAAADSALLASPQASLVRRRRRLSGAWALRLRPATSHGVAALR